MNGRGGVLQVGECEVALAWLLFATLSRCHTNETQKLLRLKGDDAAASINECRPFRTLCPYPRYQRDNAPPAQPFASVPLFPDVFRVSSPLFPSSPSFSPLHLRNETRGGRRDCDECNYARRGVKVSWRKYAPPWIV